MLSFIDPMNHSILVSYCVDDAIVLRQERLNFCPMRLPLGAANFSAAHNKTSDVVLLFCTTSEVYRNFEIGSIVAF